MRAEGRERGARKEGEHSRRGVDGSSGDCHTGTESSECTRSVQFRGGGDHRTRFQCNSQRHFRAVLSHLLHCARASGCICTRRRCDASASRCGQQQAVARGFRKESKLHSSNQREVGQGEILAHIPLMPHTHTRCCSAVFSFGEQRNEQWLALIAARDRQKKKKEKQKEQQQQSLQREWREAREDRQHSVDPLKSSDACSPFPAYC